MTLHNLVGKICISFFLFYCEGMLSLVVLWLCGYTTVGQLIFHLIIPKNSNIFFINFVSYLPLWGMKIYWISLVISYILNVLWLYWTSSSWHYWAAMSIIIFVQLVHLEIKKNLSPFTNFPKMLSFRNGFLQYSEKTGLEQNNAAICSLQLTNWIFIS